jgi:hypothetical protein
MAGVTYAFREGARLQRGARVSAQIVGEHLEGLRRRAGGELTPAFVVEDARRPKSPLHSLFEWDDGEAAAEYRLHQARGVIRSVVVVYRQLAAEEPKRVVAFVNLKQDERQFYISTAAGMANRDQRAIVLQQAWRDLQSFKRRYADLAEFAQLFATIEEIEAALPMAATA